MAASMSLVFRWSTSRIGKDRPRAAIPGSPKHECGRPFATRANRQLALLAAALAIFVGTACAQLPDGPGKAETVKLCSNCHELERSLSLRQDRSGWEATLDKMVSLGAEASDQEIKAVIDYLSANFGGVALPKLNVNKATSIELESRLSLKRSEAAAIIAYRTKNGPFKSIEDLKKVPGVDQAKIDAKKSQLTF